MCKPIIKCSRCSDLFCGGFEYRMHFDQHLDEWSKSKNKKELIQLLEKKPPGKKKVKLIIFFIRYRVGLSVIFLVMLYTYLNDLTFVWFECYCTRCIKYCKK